MMIEYLDRPEVQALRDGLLKPLYIKPSSIRYHVNKLARAYPNSDLVIPIAGIEPHFPGASRVKFSHSYGTSHKMSGYNPPFFIRMSIRTRFTEPYGMVFLNLWLLTLSGLGGRQVIPELGIVHGTETSYATFERRRGRNSISIYLHTKSDRIPDSELERMMTSPAIDGRKVFKIQYVMKKVNVTKSIG